MTVIYKKMTQTQMIVVGYLLLILLGSILLMLPVSSRDGNMTSFADALFTSTSASCVTGLVVQDTYLHWSFFGQLIILIPDPDRRYGIYDNWCLCGDSVKKKDRA